MNLTEGSEAEAVLHWDGQELDSLRRRPYQCPTLFFHGSLATITQTMLTMGNDDGGPIVGSRKTQ